jgi:integrase
VNPSGRVVWIARYTDSRGRRRIAKPSWNRGSGTFKLRRDAQRAIDEAYAMPDRSDSVGGYFATWTDRYPRTERTNDTNSSRIRSVLEVEIDGKPFADWPLFELRRRHVGQLVDHMLRKQGRAATGAAGILRSLSAMMENAIDDDLAGANPFRGVKVRRNDPRVTKRSREIRVWSFEQMREFAAAARPEVRKETERLVERKGQEPGAFSAVNYEPMLLTFALTGMRLGEILALRRAQFGGGEFRPTGTAYRGRIIDGDTNEKVHCRTVPCPPSLEFLIQTEALRDDTDLLFATPKGTVWNSSNFYRDVWRQAQLASGMDMRPHECRHSYITHMRGAGVNDADLAQIAGHRVETMLATYTHAVGQSHAQIRELLG